MGCDGGTIPKRDELVRVKKKPEQKDKEADLSFKWRNCALSQQQLQEPIVACGLGRLYSKSSILEALIDKANKPESISHIKNLKDIRDLQLSKNPAYIQTDRTDVAIDEGSAPYICPIIGLEMAGKFRFICLWSCGCTFSERALKEIKQNVCHKCQQPFTNEDIVILNGNETDLKDLQIKMDLRNAKRKSTKKRTKNEPTEALSTVASNATSTESKEDLPITSTVQPSGSKSSTLTDNIPLNLPKLKSDGPPSRCHFGSSKRAHGTELVDDPSYKKTKKDYSIAKDPKSSEVYKSLFTSHHTDKEQNRAHWITYNPFYN